MRRAITNRRVLANGDGKMRESHRGKAEALADGTVLSLRGLGSARGQMRGSGSGLLVIHDEIRLFLPAAAKQVEAIEVRRGWWVAEPFVGSGGLGDGG